MPQTCKVARAFDPFLNTWVECRCAPSPSSPAHCMNLDHNKVEPTSTKLDSYDAVVEKE